MEIDWLEKLPHESTRDFVFRLLQTNIINLNLPPGTGLSENEFADKLEVSRTPIREAFIRLAQEDLLDIQPQRGTFVSLIDPDLVCESKFVRETLERAVIRLACSTFPETELIRMEGNLALQELCVKKQDYKGFFALDEALHFLLFSGCGKTRTWEMIAKMNSHYNRVRILNLVFGFDWEQILFQHRELIRAIREHDLNRGEQISSVHLNKVLADMDQLIRNNSQYFKQTKYFRAPV